MLPTDMSRCLSLDLEVGIEDSRIYAFAGIRADTDQVVKFPGGRRSLSWALSELDKIADGANFLLGHNLIAFDLPHLRAANSGLRLLSLPVVDTLRLNPLAFPRNPYHHLVKDYQDGQLRRGRVNDPDLDARLTLNVLDNQLSAFQNAPADLLTAWHWLTTMKNGAGFDGLFSYLRDSDRPSETEAISAIYSRFSGVCCRRQGEEVLDEISRYGWEMSYALAWLSVAGGNSVMPPWVRYQFPKAGLLVRKLRDTPCNVSGCDWCSERHDARRELKRWFDFDAFRPEPADDDGFPLQQAIAESVMRGEHVLGILPTGAGKSVCYQVPALSRYNKTGALTVVISPLVALMADQVAGLEARGIDSCVTVNGMLSMPERSDSLDRVRLGDAGILLISPEQLRSRSVRRVLSHREIGAWVLDEAHCLSRWGHDFRPDYRYIGRFIRERSGEEPAPPVLCLTATAKPDVTDEIVEYFKKELDVELTVFDGGARRSNLEFVVVKTGEADKYAHVHQVIEADLPTDEPGGAIVYCATRSQAEQMAGFLQAKSIEAEYFHAGLPPETKKAVQESFIGGDLRAIAATNAFGMGIDKPDVRLVVHADIPGSLENYLQEAGRAGRDQQAARCVLLYTTDDVERQFGMTARSRLTREEIQGVLKALRNIDRKKRMEGEVVATAREVLSEDADGAFERDTATDDTRFRTAVSWLEEAALLSREENSVSVFPSSLRVGTLDEAASRLEKFQTTNMYRRQLLDIARTLIEADPTAGVTTDELMLVSGLTPEGVRSALYDLERLGIASNDTVLTAFVHSGVQRSSMVRFLQASDMEIALIDLLRELGPDMGREDTSHLNLRAANQRLRDDGHEHSLPEFLRRVVRSLGADGRGEGGQGGSLAIRAVGSDTLRITLLRGWEAISQIAETRRTAAQRILEHLLSTLPERSRGTDLLAETTLGNLLNAVRSDMILSASSNPEKLMDRALLWLHEQEVIRLNKGLTVFRPAMTILLKSDNRRFMNSDYETLRIHYDEQTLQIHIMAEYAHRGLGSMADAIRLSMDYFNMRQEDFLNRWLPNRDREISMQTTPDSWQSIVESLNNPVQRRIVADDRRRINALVLAGPGSGKTRVLVHRIAYLVRVRREDPRSILALAYNRHAAVEIRRRLEELIGTDARGVIVLTCHALAMRLVGASFAGLDSKLNEPDFDAVLRQAAELLAGEGMMPEEADELRTRLLGSFRWILVDEYQDIGADEYALISALAGRSLAETDDRLNLFAVGDDDQNIYAFNGSSVEFIRRFGEDYSAAPVHLTDNYRSTANIIAAANAVIAPSRERMKTDHPIAINQSRRRDPPGGAWEKIDPLSLGRVQILPVGDSPVSQAQAIVSEIKRMSELSDDWDWSSCAVMARDWRYLDPVRVLCEAEGMVVEMANEEFTGVWRLRETQALISWARSRESGLVSSPAAVCWLSNQPEGPWIDLLIEAMEDYAIETSEADVPVDSFIEWLAEWSRDVRRRQQGVLLTTAHRAKGLEFDHVFVLDGAWQRVSRNEDMDAPRRLYYVAMTRARQTLTLAKFPRAHALQEPLNDLPCVLHRDEPAAGSDPPAILSRRYVRLSLRDVHLSFAGNQAPRHPVHQAIAALSPGDRLDVRVNSGRLEFLNEDGLVVGRIASSFKVPSGMRCSFATVMAVATWEKQNSEPEYRGRLRSDNWEVVVPELVFEPARQKRS